MDQLHVKLLWVFSVYRGAATPYILHGDYISTYLFNAEVI